MFLGFSIFAFANLGIAEIVDMLTRDRPNGTKLSVEEIISLAMCTYQ